ncbi:MAG: lasso peptide biosynthesis B2 protein [Heyndrickxia sp.]
MITLKRIRIFFSNEVNTIFILTEAYVYLCIAKLLLFIPFSKLAPTLGIFNQETTNTDEHDKKTELKKVCHAISIMSNYTIWKSQCLVKAIAGMKMLERRKIDCTLYFGTCKDDNGDLIAHAWLRSGSFFVTGKEGMERFTIVSKFAKKETR